MGKRRNTNGDLDKGDSEEIIERLIPNFEDEDIDGQKKSGKRKKKLYKKRTEEPTEAALLAEIARQKSLEEIWEESTDEKIAIANSKSIILISSLIALISLVTGWELWKSSKNKSGSEENLPTPIIRAKEIESERLSMVTQINIASGIVDQYLVASSVDQKSKSIYQAELLKNEITAYYERNGGAKPTLDYSIRSVFPISLNGEQILEVIGKNTNSQIDNIRSYYLRKDSHGDYKVDWKADVAFQDNDVINFIETRSKESKSFKFEVKQVNKVIEKKTYDLVHKKIDYTVHHLNIPFSNNAFWGLKPDYHLGPYNWGFKDTEYSVLRLNIPNSDIYFWGYVKKGSEEESKLFSYIKTDIEERIFDHAIKHEFILKVRFLENSPQENDQYVLIDGVVSRKWVNTEE